MSKSENKKNEIKVTIKKESNFIEHMRKNSYVLSAMVKKNFRAQYRNSILGVLWTVLNPLLNMIVLSIVFSKLFNPDGNLGIYPVYILCGNLIFNMFSQVTMQSLECLVSNSDLIKKVKISYSIFPISNMFTALVNFGMACIAMIIVMLIVGQQFYWTILLTLVIIPAVILFALGVGFVLSSLYVFFRDIKHIYQVAITLWMYMTPIFYSKEALGDGFVQTVVGINPLTVFVDAFRDVIQWGIVPNVMTFLVMYAWAIGMLLVGFCLFKINRRKYILYI